MSDREEYEENIPEAVEDDEKTWGDVSQMFKNLGVTSPKKALGSHKEELEELKAERKDVRSTQKAIETADKELESLKTRKPGLAEALRMSLADAADGLHLAMKEVSEEARV